MTKMAVIYFVAFILGFVCLEVTGRAVNISGAWFLPQEGFPVFYRYFSDKVTWNEAEAVCGFHHGDLLSVQTTTQMDAARAYLKQIDVTDNIWIGLQKESPEKPFSWTNGEKLLGDGYWLEPIPKTNEKLCAAIDPVSDFRWNSFYCRGPQVASFVCELPVPEWAKKEDGCLITSLPSVIITLIPEMCVIQLFSDCGLEGTRRIACKGAVNREDLIRKLSCDEDAFATTAFSKSTTADISKEPMNSNLEVNHDETTKTFKVHETYLPQTRHRRDIDSNTLGTGVSPPHEKTDSPLDVPESDAETSTQAVSTQGKTEMSNVLSRTTSTYNPPPEPEITSSTTKIQVQTQVTTKPKKSKADSEGKTLPKPVTESITKTSTAVVPSSTLSDSKNFINEETTTEKSLKIPVYIKESSLKDKLPGGGNAVPVLIITGESFNESANSAMATSENPQIVFMIDDKDFSEPYVVPLGDDVVLNNPSLSPMEVIDVDLIEIDNSTTKTGPTSSKYQLSDVSPSQPTTPKEPESSKLLTTEDVHNESSTVPDITTTTNSSPTPVTTKSSQNPKLVTQSQTFFESDEEEEEAEIRQRPNRGRLLSHRPSHSSFYPYFLNRVWG